MWILYYAGMYLFVAGIYFTSIWNKKSREWIIGRRHQKKSLLDLPSKSGYRIWFHVSSLGEFEQAKPVIEKLKQEDADIDIVLSFFSPSGFLQKKNYPNASVFYLPADLPGNATNWIDQIKPDMAVFVKYDLWPGYLRALHQQNIPTLLISAYWPSSKKFGSWNFSLNKYYLKKFKRIFFQRAEEIEHFRRLGYNNISFAGDTRIDRVLNLPNEIDQRMPNSLRNINFDLVAGSTWQEDESLVLHAQRELGLKIIIAPHDVSPENISRLSATLTQPFQLLSGIHENMKPVDILIVDSIGLLNILYSLGTIAYVGGGFGKSVHNTLEPMAHGRPVIFGPRYVTFPEAVDMVERKSGWSVSSKEELIEVIKMLDKETAEITGNKNFQYLAEHSGATDKVSQFILDSIHAHQMS